ncbi:hypothetical protein [Caulobacter sp. BE254]|uniref:hypothetical protein n=1 Tax=Caulobacter sp. BE254 TaxID=2817720 RepID=UPI0028653359|nr:hypothetical protein [Caulobacter sp. BE254]MDR7118397.1 hypothetical protein [Caulobacter sp. BE254]
MPLACADLLEANTGALRADGIDSQRPQCRCEEFVRTALGAVDPNELLLRFIVAPQHFNEKKQQVRHQALSHAESVGMSTFRDAHTTDEQIVNMATIVIENAKRSNVKAAFKGVLTFRAARPKVERPDEGCAVYCIYDSPHHGVDGHAEIFQRVHGASEDLKQMRRMWLFETIDADLIAPEQFRGGILSHLV